jgi:hypothetical protein
MIHVMKPGFLREKPSVLPNEKPVRVITKKALMSAVNQLAVRTQPSHLSALGRVPIAAWLVLSQQEDFADQPSMLETLIKKAGHVPNELHVDLT